MVSNLLATQPLAALSTHGESGSHVSLIAFAATDDLREVLFATAKGTRKFRNLVAEPRVALLVDNRSNREADFRDAMAVTIVGRAEEVESADMDRGLTCYLRKHTLLREFVTSPGCALVRVRVEAYFVVTRFQHVQELRVEP